MALATSVSVLAMTTVVGKFCIISLANDGPERNAVGCGRCSASGITSYMSFSVATWMPLEVDMIGTLGGMTSLSAAVELGAGHTGQG